MHSRYTAALASLALPIALLTACGSDDPGVVEVTVTTTVQTSTATSSTATSTTPTPAASTDQVPAAAPATAECGAVGITGAPGVESPRCLGTQISSCGDASIHQMGTTFFTNGTSGWTQECQSRMAATYVPPPAVPTFDQDAYNEQFAEEYWSNNPRPTFDPDSADGYGPNQTLPPACLRLEGVDC